MSTSVQLGPAFLLALLPKAAIAALLVVSATVIAERAGAVLGALVATLPIGSGSVFVFLALDHDAAFISQAALSSFAQNVPTAICTACYVLLAQRLPARYAIPSSLAVWAAYLALFVLVDQQLDVAFALTLTAFPLCILLVRPYGGVTAPPGPVRTRDLAVRGAAVAAVVAVVDVLGLFAGARITGLLAAFPVVFISMMVVLQPRYGGPVAAAVLSHTVAGLAGVSAAFLTVHLLAVPLGTPLSLVLALCVSILWNGGLLVLHRMGHPHAGVVPSPSPRPAS
jgi:hypothetical protein